MSKGFTLIELMIVIMLIGVIAVMGVPRFLRPSRSEVQPFIAQLNGLVGQAASDAQQKGEPLRVFFSLSGKKIEVQTVKGKRAGGSITLPPTIEVVDVAINGKSQFGGTGEKDFFYFLINQEGISQEVRLVLKDRVLANRQHEFYLNPFTSVFRVR